MTESAVDTFVDAYLLEVHMNQALEQQLDEIPESNPGERAFAYACCAVIIVLPLWHGLKIVIFGI